MVKKNDIDWPGAEFVCGCHTESLRVTASEGEAELAIWQYGSYGSRMTWRRRLVYIWRLLRTGQPYGDQIALDKANTRKLALLLARIAGLDQVTYTNNSTAYTFTSPTRPIQDAS